MKISRQLHIDCVNAWMSQVPKGLPSEQLIKHFEVTFSMLWTRARHMISAVTLMAILDRALFNSTEHFPALSFLKVESKGLSFDDFQKKTQLKEVDLIAGFQFMLIEFFTITGTLTGEVITPHLHEALSQVKFGNSAVLKNKNGGKS